MYTPMAIFKLAAAGVLPMLFAIGFYLAEKKTAFSRLTVWAKRLSVGFVFGLLAIIATELGVSGDGAVVDVRDSAPLSAGLVFGAPAGIISGVIGGVYRWIASGWGAGIYTQIAGSLTTVFAGLIGATARKFMFDDKKPSWFYGLAIAVVTEILHMLLIFMTNIDDIQQAFSIVKSMTGAILISNGLSVTAAVLAIGLLGKEKRTRAKTYKKISQTFQSWLLICVMFAFLASCLFTFHLQTEIADTDAKDILLLNIQDIQKDISDASDNNLLQLTHLITDKITESGFGAQTLVDIAADYGVSEINVVNGEGIIILSSNPDFIGFDMSSGEQSAEFLQLNGIYNEMEEFVQPYSPISYDNTSWMKYAAVKMNPTGFIQVGYNSERFRSDINTQVQDAAKNRHIRQSGMIIICDENWEIVSDRDGNEGKQLDAELKAAIESYGAEGVCFKTGVYGETSYCSYATSEGYYIIGVLPVSEALFSRDIAVFLIAFMEVIVFAVLFATIYFLIKKVVVENIQKINASLGQITGGNLDVTVDVRSNEEFASLSDDINSTVVTLKQYIDEASARLDKELEFARTIQHSALPSVFPPYPNRKDFDIYADMRAAKEVGGDFYDFYLLGENSLAFLVADVSGKGIPGAMFMMQSKTLISSLAESGLDVAEVFTNASAQLCQNNEAGMFVTAWMGVLDLKTGLLRYANAGHNPPVIRRARGNFEYLKTKPNFILAGMEGVRYKANELQLYPGDMVFLYTDGVTEATDASEQLYGEDRLLEALEAAKDDVMENLCRRVVENVDEFVGDAPQFDDMTTLAIRLNYTQDRDLICLPVDKRAALYLSDFIDKKNEEFEVSMKVANRVQIAADEVISNIMNHSSAAKVDVIYKKSAEGMVMIFSDDGVEYNPLTAEDPDVTKSSEEREIGGLGIYMVKKLTSDMTYEYRDNCNILRLTFSV